MFSKLGFASLFFVFGVQSAVAFTGQATWYHISNPAGGPPQPGACGQIHTDSGFVAAVAHDVYDSYPGAGANPNTNPICGKKIKVTYLVNGVNRVIVVKVVDRCADCPGLNIDLSPVAFSVLADQSVGRLSGVEWDYTEDEPGPSTTVGLGVSVRAVNQNQTAPDLTARADLPPDAFGAAPGGGADPHEKKNSKQTKREDGPNENLTKRTEREVPPSVVGAAPGGGPAPHVKRSFSESFKKEDMQKRGRMVKRHRRSIAHQGVDEPVA